MFQINNHIHEQLTDDNYDEKTKGKGVFVKFYLPHCGHSLALVPVWDELESAYHLNSTHLVQRISCEDEHGRKNVKLCRLILIMQSKLTFKRIFH